MSEPKNPKDESYDSTTCDLRSTQAPASETPPEMLEEPLTIEQTAVIDALVKYRATKKKATALIRHFGLAGVDDLKMLEEDELVQHCGLTKIQARKLLNNLKRPPAAEPTTSVIDEKVATLLDYRSVLTAPPTEEAWLSKLVEGGELKIDEFSIMSAIRALVAQQAGLYQAPGKIMKAINEYVDQMDEPASAAYYSVRTIIYRMEHPEIFGLLKSDYQFVPREDKDDLLGRIHEFIPSLKQSFKAVDDWQSTLSASYGGQGAVIAAFSDNAPGFGRIVIPSLDSVYDASSSLKDAINHAFRGRGIQTAKALAADAREITMLLDDPEIPPLVGVSSREQLLRKLGIGITPNYVRQEESFSMFAQNLLAFSNGAAEGNEFRFLMGLWTLGRTLNWKLLSNSVNDGGDAPFECGSVSGRAGSEEQPEVIKMKSATGNPDQSRNWL